MKFNKVVKEFKDFAVRGNMIDLAVGVVIGSAFNGIVKSLVDDIIMPPLGFFINRVDFKDLVYVIQAEMKAAGGKIIQPAIVLQYGNFIQACFNFFIIALAVFALVKFINILKKKSEDINDPTVSTPKDIQLLTEIRDLLKETGNKQLP